MIEVSASATTGSTTPVRRFTTWIGAGTCPKHPGRRHVALMEVQGPFSETPEVPGGYDGPVEYCDCGGKP